MSDEEKDRVEEYAEWKERAEGEDQDPRELFRQVSNIAVCMSYDLIDKLRWWEKETLKLSDDEVGKRLPHMTAFLDQLKMAYLEFSDIDL